MAPRAEQCVVEPNQSMVSISIFGVLAICTVAWYASCFFAPQVIKLKPWEIDAWILASTAGLMAALAAHPYIADDTCEVFTLFVHFWLAVHLVANHTKTLRSIFQTIKARNEARVAAAPSGSWSERARKNITKLYMNNTYCTILAFAAVIALVVIGAAMMRAEDVPKDADYCYVAPSAMVAAMAYGFNLLVQAILVYVLYRIGLWTPVVPLQIILLLAYAILLGTALGAYVYDLNWTQHPYGWGAAYTMATLYLYSQLLHFVVPAWVATVSPDAASNAARSVRTHVRRCGQFVRGCCGFGRASQLGIDDDDLDATDQELLITPRAGTSSDGSQLPKAVSENLSRMRSTQFDTHGPPSVRAGVLTAQRALDALITERALYKVCLAANARPVLDVLHAVLDAFEASPSDVQVFRDLCAKVYTRANESGLQWPDTINLRALVPHLSNVDPVETTAGAAASAPSEVAPPAPAPKDNPPAQGGGAPASPEPAQPSLVEASKRVFSGMASSAGGLRQAAITIVEAGVKSTEEVNGAVVALRAVYAWLSVVLEQVIADANKTKDARRKQTVMRAEAVQPLEPLGSSSDEDE